MTVDSTYSTRYAEMGFLVVESLVDHSLVESVRERLMLIGSGGAAEFPTSDIEFEPDTGSGVAIARKINRCVENDVFFNCVASDPRVLGVVEQLIGPDIELYSSQCFMKPPGGVEKPYHQDAAYFSADPDHLVTCWVALDNVTVDNGCVWVIPGSHRGPLLDHSEPWQVGDRMDKRIPESQLDRRHETALTMAVGGCSFHHSMLLHRSGANHSDRPRRALALHYQKKRSS